MKAIEKLEARSERSLLCIGLDPDFEKLPKSLRSLEPAEAIKRFNRRIVEATADLVCAYKPNLAFYERYGASGWEALKDTLRLIPPEVPVILDAKRGDIGNSARFYAESLFEELGGDGVTVNPYLGRDGIQPFLDFSEKITFLLAATSNPGAADFQTLESDGLPLFRRVARLGVELDGKPGNIGLVAGATDPNRFREIRREAEDLWLLVPGVGAQGGDLDALDTGNGKVLINASRSILYSSGGEDFEEAARRAALELRAAIERRREHERSF